ncbi:MAG: ABC transporter permease [Candidatus Handelsmanbacteria bacterium]|nr:ABC transporter permease [Candidatus Handelsmanbacteria bacterium]
MSFADLLFMGWTQLRAHALRSLLTLLGMLIGVGAVVGIVSISEGMRRFVIGEFGKIGGDNLIMVRPMMWVERHGRWTPNPHYEPLILDDMDRIAALPNRFAAVLPVLARGMELRHEKATFGARVEATLPSYTSAFQWEVERGRFLDERDLQGWRSVCVLGTEVAEKLFGAASPLGQEVKMNGQRFTVVGTMEEKKLFEDDWGNRVLVPLSTAQLRLFGRRELNGLVVLTEKPEDVPKAVAAIEASLERSHGPKAEFRIDTGKGFLQQIEQSILVMKLATGGIAAISLLVGGIGIMNIMLVSVTERTREIGIRKALGAKPRHLVFQFVSEAVVLSFTGGVLGVLGGIGLGRAISAVIEHYAEVPFFPSLVSMGAVGLSLGVSIAIGLFFGIYPALRASRLDPVEALRYE